MSEGRRGERREVFESRDRSIRERGSEDMVEVWERDGGDKEACRRGGSSRKICVRDL